MYMYKVMYEGVSEKLSAGPTESLAVLRLSHHKFIDKTAYAKFVKCFQTCFCFLNLHIGVNFRLYSDARN